MEIFKKKRKEREWCDEIRKRRIPKFEKNQKVGGTEKTGRKS